MLCVSPFLLLFSLANVSLFFRLGYVDYVDDDHG